MLKKREVGAKSPFRFVTIGFLMCQHIYTVIIKSSLKAFSQLALYTAVPLALRHSRVLLLYRH